MEWRWEAEWRQGDGVQWQVPQKYTVLLLVCLFDSNLEKQSPRLLTPPPIHQHLTPTNLCLCRKSRLLIAKLLKSISQSWPQSASSNRPLHSTRLQNGQVKGKVENEDEQSRIVQSPNQKLSPRVRLLTAEASSNDGRQSSNLSTLLEEAEQVRVFKSSLRTLKRIACTNCEQENEK